MATRMSEDVRRSVTMDEWEALEHRDAYVVGDQVWVRRGGLMIAAVVVGVPGQQVGRFTLSGYDVEGQGTDGKRSSYSDAGRPARLLALRSDQE